MKDIKEIDLKYSLLSVASEHLRKNKKKEELERLVELCKHLEPEFSTLLLRFLKNVDEKFFSKEITSLKSFKWFCENYGKYFEATK